MRPSSISGKLFSIAFIGGIAFIASMLVLGLTVEREERSREAAREIAQSWGERQTIAGPMLLASIPGKDGEESTLTVFPSTLTVEASLVPELRERGIFRVPVYRARLAVSGDFSSARLWEANLSRGNVILSVPITDTRGVDTAPAFSWGGKTYPAIPGIGASFAQSSGFHARVPVDPSAASTPFSFSLELNGSEGFFVAPIGDENSFHVSSTWASPKFSGAFLPTGRTISDDGFDAIWKISAFGRSYPSVFRDTEILPEQVLASAAGVDLYPGVDLYDLVMRSVKYAILFIVVTFAALFLFDVRSRVRIHAVQYLLFGSALALFYLLLLSLSEHIGFLPAYAIGAGMIALLVSLYAFAILRSVARTGAVAGVLLSLYAYLYFVLSLEDYALLFGALLLFLLLATLMYATRKIDWYAIDQER